MLVLIANHKTSWFDFSHKSHQTPLSLSLSLEHQWDKIIHALTCLTIRV